MVTSWAITECTPKVLVYSNWTPRSNKYFPEATEGSVVFGIQYLIKEYLIKQMKTAKLLGLDEDFELYTNESPVFPNSEKPYYNILLDDRAGLEESYEILKYVVDEIKLNQQGNQ